MRRQKREAVRAGIFLLVLAAASIAAFESGRGLAAENEFYSAAARAAAGDAQAMLHLAMLYQTGIFCGRDPDRAGDWYRRAVSADSRMANMREFFE